MKKRDIWIGAVLGVVFLVAAITFVYLMSVNRRRKDEAFEQLPKVEFFYMPKCPHCENFKPEWDKFVKASADQVSTELIDIKTPEGGAKAKAANVSSFPHVQKGLPDGSVEVFKGSRTLEGLMKFAQ